MNAVQLRTLCIAGWVWCALPGSAHAEDLVNPESKPVSEKPPPPSAAGEVGIDYQPKKTDELITFNLEDADLADLVRLISQATGRSFILPSKSRSLKATVYAPIKVTTAEAYQAFLSILELNGMSVVREGRYEKIVESAQIERRALPLSVGGQGVPDGDRYVTHMLRVKNVPAEEASKVLEHFKSADGGITVYAPTNTLILTDTGTNLRRMLRILEEIDIPRTGEQMWVEPVNHATALDLAKRLTEVFDVAGSGSAGDKNAKPAVAPVGAPEVKLTKVVADERTNALVIVATEPAYLRVLALLDALDVSMEGEGHIHVHHLQHSDAEEVAKTLSDLIAKNSRDGGGAKPGQSEAPAMFEGKVAVTAHKAKNSLVITSSNHDFAALKSVIDMMDSENKQVFIEVVIMELNVSRGDKLNLGYHGGVPNAPSDQSLSVLGFNSLSSVSGISGMAGLGDLLSGLAIGVQGPTVTASTGLQIPSFGVAMQAIASSGDTNVLSTPSLIASDNVEAEIKVGQNVPLQTSSFGSYSALPGLLSGAGSNQASSLAAASALSGLGNTSSVPRDNVGIVVTITPHINETEEIRLSISEENSSPEAPSTSGNLGVRTINRTQAKTEVVVKDQQTVVIGGLMQDALTTTETKIPLLGDIPLIGALFRSHETTKKKKNLLLFLTPYIIRSQVDLQAIYERKIRERQEFIDRYFVFSDSEYTAPVDYSRTRGLLGEMLKDLAAIDNEKKLAREAALKPEPGHGSKPAIGEAAGT